MESQTFKKTRAAVNGSSAVVLIPAMPPATIVLIVIAQHMACVISVAAVKGVKTCHMLPRSVLLSSRPISVPGT